MTYSINSTVHYHTKELETLGWELTVCNAMESENSPIRKILKIDDSFGNHLNRYLKKNINMSAVDSVLEIGGGYGFLLRDILQNNREISAVSIDISSKLINKQKDILNGYNVSFVIQDVLTVPQDYFNQFDLVILNENMGDFPTIVNIPTNKLVNKDADKDLLEGRVFEIISKYDLALPKTDTINFNLGAVEIIEKLCTGGVRYIYASEHCCEPIKSESFEGRIRVQSEENPEAIYLKGHVEYTVKFSYLQRIAEFNGYSVIRGSYSDIIEIINIPEMNYILTSNSVKDDHEIIRQFLEDLLKYEFLLLIKK